LQQQLNGSKVRIPAVGRINYNGNSGAATAISTTELAKAEGVTNSRFSGDISFDS